MKDKPKYYNVENPEINDAYEKKQKSKVLRLKKRLISEMIFLENEEMSRGQSDINVMKILIDSNDILPNRY